MSRIDNIRRAYETLESYYKEAILNGARPEILERLRQIVYSSGEVRETAAVRSGYDE